MDRRAFLAAGVAAVGPMAGCGQVGSVSREDFDVGMSSTAFLPRKYEVRVGEPVVWGNSSSRAHTVTAYADGIPDGAEYFASGGFDSESTAREGWIDGKGGIAPGETYRHTFETADTYRYFCIPHEPAGMVGTIVVET